MTIKNIAFRSNYPVLKDNTARKNLSFGLNLENASLDQPDQLELTFRNPPENMKPFFPDKKQVNRMFNAYNKLNPEQKEEINDFVFNESGSGKNSYELLKESNNLTKDEKQTLKELAVKAKETIFQLSTKDKVDLHEKLNNISNNKDAFLLGVPLIFCLLARRAPTINMAAQMVAGIALILVGIGLHRMSNHVHKYYGCRPNCEDSAMDWLVGGVGLI